MVTDVVADFITRIRNASAVKKDRVAVPYSQMRYNIARKLVSKNFLTKVEKEGHGVRKQLVLTLSYGKERAPQVRGIQRVSKPGCRVYSHIKDVHPHRQGTGCVILSTSKGILADDEARKERVGGEVLFTIW